MTSLLASNLSDFGGGIGGTKKRKQVVVLLFYSQHYDEPDLKMRCSPLLWSVTRSVHVLLCLYYKLNYSIFDFTSANKSTVQDMQLNNFDFQFCMIAQKVIEVTLKTV